jgi:hypothetical protein
MEVEVLTRLDEDPDNPKFWTIEDVDKAINRGYECISEATEWYETIVGIPLTARRLYYDLRGFKVQPLVIRHLYNLQTQRWLNPGSVRELDTHYRHWQHLVGSPEMFFIRGMHHLALWPMFTSDGERIRVSMTAIPPRLVRGPDTPGFDEDLHFALVNYALYRLRALRREPKTALNHYAEYLVDEKTLAERVKTRQDHDKLQYLGGL